MIIASNSILLINYVALWAHFFWRLPCFPPYPELTLNEPDGVIYLARFGDIKCLKPLYRNTSSYIQQTILIAAHLLKMLASKLIQFLLIFAEVSAAILSVARYPLPLTFE